ncbi:VOC family protein [Actinomadura meridiana]|uniref:VOC family protein n=1 Tax=Actinomadura meridiana TaxID=559626 RepID=A0ABP8CFY0_9ACTN
MTREDLKLSACALAVHDLDKALAFYRDVLGFKVRTETTRHGTRQVSVTPPSQPDTQILLQSSSTNPTVSPTDQNTIADLMTKGLLGYLVFITDNCDSIFEHLEAAGAEVIQEPITRPNNDRDCAFLDPSGNLLRFTQPHWPHKHSEPSRKNPTYAPATATHSDAALRSERHQWTCHPP